VNTTIPLFGTLCNSGSATSSSAEDEIHDACTEPFGGHFASIAATSAYSASGHRSADLFFGTAYRSTIAIHFALSCGLQPNQGIAQAFDREG
jgi:hypothetical protein